MRAFVALPCPPGLRKALDEAGRQWRPLDADVGWVKPEVAHLTLRFLGRASGEQLEALDRVLRSIAGTSPPIEMTPASTGAFPGWRRARVLWLGLETGGALESMAERIEQSARDAGFAPEERGFRAHLTLGRVRSPRGLEAAAEAVRGWAPASGPETASTIVLYRSDLGGAGPRYTPIETYALTGRGTT